MFAMFIGGGGVGGVECENQNQNTNIHIAEHPTGSPPSQNYSKLSTNIRSLIMLIA